MRGEVGVMDSEVGVMRGQFHDPLRTKCQLEPR